MANGYRSSASFGKRQEFAAIAELLKRGFDVYLTLVDDQGIDCIIRREGNPPAYLDIQIKARSRQAKHPGIFTPLKIPDPRPNYFFIFYSEAAECYWVVPSLDFVREANCQKGGANKGTYTATLAAWKKNGEISKQPKWKRFEDRFDLLEVPLP